MQYHISNWNHWEKRCADALRGNLPDPEVLTKLKFRYTCPAKKDGIYLPRWKWDSDFHAATYRHFDPEMAWEELQGLFVHQVAEGPDAGMLPHMAYFSENDDVNSQNLFRHPHRSILTQPALTAIVALAVHQKLPRPDILKAIYPKLAAYHDWFDRRRDPDNDRLAAIIHPWESGWDASQRWDQMLGITKDTPNPMELLLHKRVELVGTLFEHHCDAESLMHAEDGFYVEPADFNAIRAADLDALAEIAREIGKEQEEIDAFRTRAEGIRQAIQEKMITVNGENRLHVHDLVGADEQKNSPDSASKFVLLFGQCVNQEQAELLRGELNGNGSFFNTPYRIATMPTDNRLFDGREYWRGNVWLPINWLIFTGLRRYRFFKEAEELAKNSLDLVERSGFCEFFNPINGKRGQKFQKPCPQNQSWSTIVLDMLAECKESLG
ncbi:MAG: hypothetical protein GY796_16025 [Chloroflexi bacterium]|nr:hypothetical protein [Chloroflexota bacterium]